jgi:hypothetical protein
MLMRKARRIMQSFKRPDFWKGLGIFSAGTALFALAYTQAPMFGPNQDQYFLHGLARAGYGFLSADWLAGTLDPTPLFSLLVEAVYRLTHWLPAFYLVYALLLGIYYFSVIDICSTVFSFRVSSAARWALALGALLVHSVLFRALIARALPGWGGYVLEDGLAEQRILGAVLQPSVFGIFLVVSIRFFLFRRPFAAVLLAVLAAAFHPTYLLCAAMLTLAYLIVMTMQDRDPKRAVLTGGLALLCALPVALYTFSVFAGSSSAATAEAYRILVHERLPHHAVPANFCNPAMTTKLILVALALFFVRRSRLFPVLLVPALLGAGLTLLQLATGSDALALLFPWRISSVLVPLSSLLILSAALDLLFRRWNPTPRWERLAPAAALGAMCLLAAAGIVKMALDSSEAASQPELGLYRYITANHQAGEVYLIPPKMEGFRLATGSAAYIDFKSIPYRDLDVLEWYRRVQVIDQLYLEKDCSVAEGLHAQGAVTHLVLPVDDFPLGCPGTAEVYRDEYYGLYTYP